MNLPALTRHRPRSAASLLVLLASGVLQLSWCGSANAARPGVRLPSGTIPQFQSVQSGRANVNPAQPYGTGQRLVIDQLTPQAILNWLNFNIAADSEVRFNQPSATSEVLNRIFDADPTIIQGRLVANGRVYLENQNGIIFDRGSQTDVRGLIASSLHIDDTIFGEGVFYNRGNATPMASGQRRLIDGGADVVLLDLEGRPLQNDVVNYGTMSGEFVMLMAPRVENRGTITTQNGQVMLAAGERVFVSPNLMGDGKANPEMRGLVVEVAAGAEAVNLSELVAANFGTLQADRGNVTMAGLVVNQMGRISAGTAVTQNGSVWLVAGSRAATGRADPGKVLLGAGSITETPLLDDGTTVREADSYQQGRVRILAQDVVHAGTITSHGGEVEIAPLEHPAGAPTEGRVYLAEGSTIDVSGNWANLSYDKNFVGFKVQSNNLRDAPLQRGGALFEQQVRVDLRRADPAYFSLETFRNDVRRGVLEKAAKGGSVSITSGTLVTRPGSVVNISGGGYRYAGGSDATSKVMVNGKFVDIHDAPANRPVQAVIEVYDTADENLLSQWNADGGRRLVMIRDRGNTVFEVIPDAKWLTSPRLVATALGRMFGSSSGFVEGKAAGKLTANVSQAVLAGKLVSETTVGAFQRSSNIPAAGTFVLGLNSESRGLNNVSIVASPTPLAAGFNQDSPLPAESLGRAEIAASMLDSQVGKSTPDEYRREGVGTVSVYARDRIDMGAGVGFELVPGGSLTLDATAVDIAGNITVPGGSVTLTGRQFTTGSTTGFSSVKLRSGAVISTAGQWTNDFIDGVANDSRPIYSRGGKVTISAVATHLEAGSLVDASGGGRLTTGRKLSFGNGGDITVRSLRDAFRVDNGDANNLILDGSLRSWSGARGGTLTLGTNSVSVDGATSTVSNSPAGLALGAGFFRQNGFSGYTLEARTQAKVTAGTQVRPVAASLVLTPAAALGVASGRSLVDVARREVLREGQRPAASFSMRLDRPVDAPEGMLEVAAGARIETDATGSIFLSASSAGAPTSVLVAGTLRAPAGTIEVSSSVDGLDAFGGQTLRIADGARIEAPGAVVVQDSVPNKRLGEVLRGGEIRINAKRNDLEIESGATLDVSGTASEFDLPALQNGVVRTARRQVAGDAGTVSITVTEDARIAGTLLGRAAPGSAGGTFAIDSRFHGQNGLPAKADARYLDGVDHRVVVAAGSPAPRNFEAGVRRATVDVAQLTAGGFDKLSFSAQDSIELASGLDLQVGRALRFDAPVIKAGGSAPATVKAPLIELLNTHSEDRPSTGGLGLVDGVMTYVRSAVATARGDGTVTFAGGRVEMAGYLTFNGFRQATIDSSGEILARGFAFGTGVKPGLENIELKTKLGGGLTTTADLTLKGRQVVAGTAVGTSLDAVPEGFQFRVADVAADGSVTPVAGGVLKIESSGGAPSPVLSAGGILSFDADKVTQSGVVKAPLGEIRLNGRTTLTLEDGSLTSVSAEGQTIPFGSTVNGLSWFYGPVDRTASPPEKRIDLRGASVAVAEGAVLDISGGGDIQALEFLPGPGGSQDTLIRSDTYAIVPTLALERAPADSHIAKTRDLGLGATTTIYDSIEIAAGSEIPAGTYALLPGQYALLPGAYLVRAQPTTGTRDFAPGAVGLTALGGTVVAGRRAVAGTSVRESRWTAYSIQPGSAALRESEYRISGSDFLAKRAAARGAAAPELARDAGRVAIAPTADLSFLGTLRANAPAGGRTGQVDITAERLAVVARAGAGTAPAGYFELEAGTLSRFGASVLLGGTRSGGAEAQKIDVVSRSVLVANDQENELEAPELVFAATEELRFASGSSVSAAGAAGGVVGDLQVAEGSSASSAVVRLTADKGGEIHRLSAPNLANPEAGKLTIEAGATLASQAGIALDASGHTSLAGQLKLPEAGGTLAMAASRITLGGNPAGGEGIGLTESQIAALGTLDKLTLRSYTSLDVVGGAKIGSASFNALTLDAPGVKGLGSDAATTSSFAARTVTLQNSTGQAYNQPATGRGKLEVDAQQLVLGAGAKTIAGFDEVKLTGHQTIMGRGKGSLDVAGDLTMVAGRVSGESRSRQEVAARDLAGSWRSVRIAAETNLAAALSLPPSGGYLAISGRSIDQGGRIELPGGTIVLAAMGAATGNGAAVLDGTTIGAGSSVGDGVVLRAGSITSVAGVRRDFQGQQEAIPGGAIRLDAEQGGVLLETAGLLDVSAPEEGGDLTIGVPKGVFTAKGDMIGGGAETGGEFTLDAAAIDDLGGLGEQLATGGFNERIDLRSRTTSLVLKAGETLAAREIALAADAGDIDITGTLDASGASGGQIELWAGRDLFLRGGALLAARGLAADVLPDAAYGHGGRVSLSAGTGVLDFAAGAVIDVSANAAGKSDGGEVVFTARRTGDTAANIDLAMSLAGSVVLTGGGQGATESGQVVLEAVKTYENQSTTDARSDIYTDYTAFVGAESRLLAKRPQGVDAAHVVVRPVIELSNTGAMTHSTEWALNQATAADNWLQGSGGGRLVLRATGDLDIRNAIGFGINQRPDAYPAGLSWAVDLVGGADLSAANPLAIARGATSGDVLLSTDTARIGTGSGGVRIAAARDVAFNSAGVGAAANLSASVLNSGAAVFTTGQMGDDRRFGTDGGDISITAGRNAVYDRDGLLDPAEFPNVWLRRTTATSMPSTVAVAEWWSEPRLFRRGVAAMGGGDVRIDAGGDVSGLSAYAPTAGRRVNNASGAQELAVLGGGDLRVTAGGDIVGGYYLVGRGSAEIEAGGRVGSEAEPVAALIMGASDDPGLRRADFSVRARTGIHAYSPSNPTALPLPGQVAAGNTVQPEYGAYFPPAMRLTQNNQSSRSTFFTYAPTASYSARTVGGDVVVTNHPTQDAQGSGVFVGRSSNGMVYQRLDNLEILPPIVELVSFDGDVRSPDARSTSSTDNLLTMFPGTAQSLQVLAGGSVRDLVVDMLDVAPDQLPGPVGNFLKITHANQTMGPLGNLSALADALRYNSETVRAGRQRLVATADPDARVTVIATTGDIADSVFTLWQPASLIAGRDVRNLQLGAQNLAADDLTLVRAGRDVIYTGQTEGGRVMDRASSGIDIGGPGSLLVQAGRNIDFGIGKGILAKGAADNRNLPTANSARVSLLAGVSGDVALERLDGLMAQLKSINIDTTLGGPEKLARVDALLAETFQGLAVGEGDISMLFSQVRTDGGSGIDLMAPQGAINVGLPTPLADANAELGILTTLGGDIRLYSAGNVTVNLSKIVAIQGGEVVIYTRHGDVDAGRGARDSLTSLAGDVAPIMVDSVIRSGPTSRSASVDTGLRSIRPPVAAAGSGIRTVSFDPDGAGPAPAPRPGGIFLFAPEGTINAGEGGVSAAGEIFIAALQVINAGNISSGGPSAGVPTVSTGTMAGLATGAANTSAGATKGADDGMRGSAEAARMASGSFKPSFVTVEVVGFGEPGEETKNSR